MYNVGIFPVGYCTANIKKICKFFNSNQSIFNLLKANSIEQLNLPDIGAYGYSDDQFYQLIVPYFEEYDYSVILTYEPIEDNYFTRIINSNIVLITTHETDEIIKKAGRTIEDYIIISITQELAALEFQRSTGTGWENLFHPDARGCIFDFAGVKEQKIAKLVTCKICNPCREIKLNNLNQEVLRVLEKILSKISRPSILESIKHTIVSPILGFIYGGLLIGIIINILSSFILSPLPITMGQLILIIFIASMVILFPVGTYIIDLFHYKRSRIRHGH